MKTVPLYSLIESAASDGEKHLTGNVTDFDLLTKAATLKKLDEQHPGAFAFLAFHPTADEAVSGYVREGTLSDDSGPRILVLFTINQDARWGTKASLFNAPGVEIGYEEHPSYRMVRLLFGKKGSPPLPGLLLFNKFVGENSAVFVGLAGLTKDEVRQRLREVFELATRASRSDDTSPFVNELGVLLSTNGIQYVKNENVSLSEWLAKAWREVREKKYELLAVVSGLIPSGS